ncbi:MAG: hypothetical protein R3A44_03860 [Caldilineaceae bacterium]
MQIAHLLFFNWPKNVRDLMQDLVQVRGLLAKVEVVEERPFGPDALVHKVRGKMVPTTFGLS